MPHHMEKSLATLDELLDGSPWFPQLCAHAQQRVALRDAKLLLITAIDAPSGQAQGVLVGEVADT